MLSVGAYRRLSQCSDARGIFTVLAIDHRANLVAEMQKNSAQPVRYQDVVAFKSSVAQYLAPTASGILTDPDYGFPGLVNGAIPGNIGLIAPLEVTNYDPHPSQRVTNFIPNWDMQKLQQAGCNGAKLLLYFHPGSKNAQSQTEIVDQIVEQCQALHIPFFLEPIGYSLDPARPLTNAERRQLVVETAFHFSQRGVDILKLEFPLEVQQEPDERIWRAALQEVNSACSVPWTLLSGGVSFEIFLRQAALACAVGASGVMVGRAVWAEAVGLHGEARDHFLATVGYERMTRLAGACYALGTPWMERHAAPTIHENWYA